MSNTFKILLAGNGGVGKTTWMKKIKSGSFEMKYISSRAQIWSISFEGANLEIIDIDGQRIDVTKVPHIDAAIFMFDVTSVLSLLHAEWWKKRSQQLYGDIPFIMVANKCDITRSRRIKKGNADCEISVKTGLNLTEPLSMIIGKMK